MTLVAVDLKDEPQARNGVNTVIAVSASLTGGTIVETQRVYGRAALLRSSEIKMRLNDWSMY
jgi:hypothetical protein